jgi:hypothetical protein
MNWRLICIRCKEDLGEEIKSVGCLLENVRNILVEFGFGGEEGRDYLIGAWLHDVLEDTETSQEFLQQTFGTHATAMVWAVTGRGANRRERNEDAYKKMIAYPEEREKQQARQARFLRDVQGRVPGLPDAPQAGEQVRLAHRGHVEFARQAF